MAFLPIVTVVSVRNPVVAPRLHWFLSMAYSRSRVRRFAVLGLVLGSMIPAALALRELSPAAAWGFAALAAFGSWLFGSWLGRREQRLLASSMRDSLTGLWNRAAFDERLDVELERASRGGRPLSLLFIDIDHLKTINDRYGHLSGDAAIRHVAECLRSSCRTSDVSCRIGGDELAVIAPDTDRVQARNLAERIRTGVVLFPARAGRRSLEVSVSIGVADVAPDRAPHSAELVARADELLYAAKRHGRNRVVVAGDSRSNLRPLLRPVPTHRPHRESA